MTNIALVAGEPSADHLAGALLRGIRAIEPDAVVSGLGGPEFVAAGGNAIASMDAMAVMGLLEVVAHLPRLLALRARLVRHFLAQRPDVFVGIDAPDFNLDLELQLRRKGIHTVQYVGPSVWAWRRYRLRKIARAVERVLVLFPFEQAIYDAAGIACTCVGHPLADEIALEPDRGAARQRLGLDAGAIVVALLPGSRRAEIRQHAGVFLQAADWIARQCPEARFVVSLRDDQGLELLRDEMNRLALGRLPIHMFCNRTADALAAADAALVASGTVTLEALLFKCPMVVAYRMHPLSYHILRALVSVRHVSLPNLLCGAEVVPELLQDQCRPERIGAEVLRWLQDPAACAVLRRQFMQQHLQLRHGASARAAAAILAVARGA
jgi:lipid-A-disaccharide synthase